MISIERCRQVLGPIGHDLTDAQVERLREQLYGLANITVAVFLENERPNQAPPGCIFDLVDTSEPTF